MAGNLSHADAVKILGAKESKLVSALDRVLGGALLGGVALGVSELLGWFDAKVPPPPGCTSPRWPTPTSTPASRSRPSGTRSRPWRRGCRPVTS